MIELLNNQPTFTIVCGLLGLCVGSFLNVVIYRLPKKLEQEWRASAVEVVSDSNCSCASCGQVFKPVEIHQPRIGIATPRRSQCPHCGHMLTSLENIPLLSYLFLRGKCSHCKAPISLRYPIVELITALLSAAAGWHFGFGWAAAGALVFVWAMVSLTYIDLDTQLLPDDITLPLLWLGILLNLGSVFTTLESSIIGAVAGYMVLWLIYWAFKILTGKEGMGYGDFKLLAAIGAWFGWQTLPIVILLSSAVGAIVGISLILFYKHGRDARIPFGPYLAAAGLLALFFGPFLSLFLFPQSAG